MASIARENYTTTCYRGESSPWTDLNFGIHFLYMRDVTIATFAPKSNPCNPKAVMDNTQCMFFTPCQKIFKESECFWLIRTLPFHLPPEILLSEVNGTRVHPKSYTKHQMRYHKGYKGRRTSRKGAKVGHHDERQKNLKKKFSIHTPFHKFFFFF